MNKTEIYVPINNRKEAKTASVVLESLGEHVSFNYFKDSDTEYGNNALIYCKTTNTWLVFQSGNKKQITLKQLIELLATGSVKAFEIEKSHNNLKESGIAMINACRELEKGLNNFIEVSIYNATTNAVPPQKTAVKVKNEKEYYSLMNYYENSGRKLLNGRKSTDFSYEGFSIIYVDVKDLSFLYPQDDIEDYDIIPFPDFAKEHNIKLPLIKSENGVWLYDGDNHYSTCVNDCNVYPKYGVLTLNNNCVCVVEPEKYKAFSTREAAENWIEAHKPKEKKIKIGSVECTVTKNGVSFDKSVQFLMDSSIQQIINAMEELSNAR